MAHSESTEVLHLPAATLLATMILGSSMWLALIEAIRLLARILR